MAERGRGRERDLLFHILMHLLIITPSLTGNQVCNLGVSGRYSNQLSYLAKTPPFFCSQWGCLRNPVITVILYLFHMSHGFYCKINEPYHVLNALEETSHYGLQSFTLINPTECLLSLIARHALTLLSKCLHVTQTNITSKVKKKIICLYPTEMQSGD